MDETSTTSWWMALAEWGLYPAVGEVKLWMIMMIIIKPNRISDK